MNRITLQPTIFENRPGGKKTYGYRMYDDYGQTYLNTWGAIPRQDFEVLQKAVDDGDAVAQDMFGHIIEHETGIFIGKRWYQWEEIEHLFV